MEKRYRILLIAFFFFGLSFAQKNVDLIIYNAKIYTINQNFDRAEAMAVSKGKIVAIGTDNDILKKYTSSRKININEYDNDKGHHKKEQWIFETEGANILGSMEISGIDHFKTTSNNIIEIYEIFGIEAARQTLLNELRVVLLFDGSYVNYRHLALLVDSMTCRGYLTSITRHGINRIMDVGPLTKSSFEETLEVLTDAAIYNEIDNLKSISDAVCNIRRSKLPDPSKIGNAGSFFKNPEISANEYAPLKREFPEMVAYELPDGNVKLAAGWLIEQCGWKGKVVGQTGSHKDQALVLVNYGGATGSEIKDLAYAIQASVQKKFHVTIEPEVNIL